MTLYSNQSDMYNFLKHQARISMLSDLNAGDVNDLSNWLCRLHRLMAEMPVCDRGRFIGTPGSPAFSRMRDIAKTYHKDAYYGFTISADLQSRVNELFSERSVKHLELLRRYYKNRHRRNWARLKPLEIDFDTMVSNPCRFVVSVRMTGDDKKHFAFIP